MERLLAAGADPNKATADGVTPVLRACSGGHFGVLDALLVAGAKPNRSSCGPDGAIPLLVAAGSGAAAAVQVLLAAGAPPGRTDRHGNCALLLAAMRGYVGIAEYLLAAGADPDQRSKKGVTPLIAAASQAGHTSLYLPLLSAATPVTLFEKSRWHKVSASMQRLLFSTFAHFVLGYLGFQIMYVQVLMLTLKLFSDGFGQWQG